MTSSLPTSSTPTNRVVPSVLALALLSGVAVELRAGDGPEISPTFTIQSRVDINDGTQDNGPSGASQDYIPGEGVGKADTADFYLRRLRFGSRFSYGDWSGRVLLEADNAGRTGVSTKGANAAVGSNPNSNSAVLGIYDAYAQYKLKTGDLNHIFRVGYFASNFNKTPQTGSADHQFASGAASGNLANNRNGGVEYVVAHPLVELTVSVQNARGDGTTGQAATNTNPAARDDGDGLWYSARLQLNGPDQWRIDKWTESFLGAEGKGIAIGLEYASEEDRSGAANVVGSTATTTSYGIDVLFHFDALSALFEYRTQKVETDFDAPATFDTDLDTTAIRLQAGYAFKLDNGTVLEPAVRVQLTENKSNVAGSTPDRPANFGSGDSTTSSGTAIDLGLNWYLAGQKNKLSFLYTKWTAKEGDADADIVRFQHQISF